MDELTHDSQLFILMFGDAEMLLKNSIYISVCTILHWRTYFITLRETCNAEETSNTGKLIALLPS